MGGVTIVATGRYAPGTPVPNDDLARVMATSDEWIRPRSGIKQRHFAAEGEGVSDMAKEATLRALESSKIDAHEIDYIIFCTMTPEHVFPGSGALLGSKIGIPGVPALDIRQQCAAIPFALEVANALIVSGVASTVLVAGAEAHAGFMPWDWNALENPGQKPSDESYAFATEHRGTAVLFGDGAGAMLLRRTDREGAGILGTKTRSDGRGVDQIWIRGGMFTRRHYWEAPIDSQIPTMKGTELFKNAVTLLPKVVRELCAEKNVALSEIDWFIAHQANDRINAAVRDSLGAPSAKVPSNIANYGNTSAATIPILVDEMMRDGRMLPGQLLCFLALGAGLNWGTALMRL